MTTAFYKVETALTRANSSEQEHGASATGKANANAGDRSSYVAMAIHSDRFGNESGY